MPSGKRLRIPEQERINVLFLCERGVDRSKKAHEHFLNALKGSGIEKRIRSEHAGSRTIDENHLNNFDHIIAFTDEPVVMQNLNEKLAPNADLLIKLHEWTANDRLSEKTGALVEQLKEEFAKRKQQDNLDVPAIKKPHMTREEMKRRRERILQGKIADLLDRNRKKTIVLPSGEKAVMISKRERLQQQKIADLLKRHQKRLFGMKTRDNAEKLGKIMTDNRFFTLPYEQQEAVIKKLAEKIARKLRKK